MSGPAVGHYGAAEAPCPPVGGTPAEFVFDTQGGSVNVPCLALGGDTESLEDVQKVIDETFGEMEELYGLNCNGSPFSVDTSTWLRLGAINLAHRVVRLERDAATQTRDLEDSLTKLLEND